MNGLNRLAYHPASTKHMLRRLVSVAVMLALVLGVFATTQPAAAETDLVCSEQTLSVTLSLNATEHYNVVGTLCSQGPAAGKTVQLLLHGATYDRSYWDFPYQREHYSYVLSATKRGYATFNLDRIGNGASDHPNSGLVDMVTNGFVIHQVVQALRNGAIQPGFAKVIVVGHSMGSLSTLQYASAFPGEANGIILTGFSHDIDWTWANGTFLPSFYPAAMDPKFSGQFPGDYYYFTSLPGTRGVNMYYQPNADPAVIALDESLKQTVTYAELMTGGAIIYTPISLSITGPVQIVIGQYDLLFCGPLINCADKDNVQAFEESQFSSAACVDTEVINDAGHVLNLHNNANATYIKMLAWADRTVGATAATPPEPCGP